MGRRGCFERKDSSEFKDDQIYGQRKTHRSISPEEQRFRGKNPEPRSKSGSKEKREYFSKHKPKKTSKSKKKRSRSRSRSQSRSRLQKRRWSKTLERSKCDKSEKKREIHCGPSSKYKKLQSTGPLPRQSESLRKERGVEMYYDDNAQSQRVRLDGYGANGPPEVLVNMMAVDPSIKVHFRAACMTCGKDISRASTENHFISGACCRKAESLASGGLVFCSYCEVRGAHWVQACPLLVSFCFACWVWGHTFLHHQVADENYLIRLMRRFNEMREWHHVNLRSKPNSKTIPSNTLVPSSSQDSHIIFKGDYNEVLGIA